MKKKDGKVIEKEMLIRGVYRITTLELKIHDFTEKIFKSLENRYKNLHKKMEGSMFNFTCLSKQTIKQT